MTAKPVLPRAQARADVDLAVDHYVSEAGADVAINYIDALKHAYAFIGRTPRGPCRWGND